MSVRRLFLISSIKRGVITPSQNHLMRTLPLAFFHCADHGSGIKVIKDLDENLINIKKWPKWTGEPSTAEWSFDRIEMAYVIKGRMTITPLDSNRKIDIGQGDFIEFSKGLRCHVIIHQAVEKVYTENSAEIANVKYILKNVWPKFRKEGELVNRKF